MVYKLPPFGKPLFNLQESNFAPKNTVFIWVGANGWNKAKNFAISMPNRTLLLPLLEHASSYYWPVKQCDILIIGTSPLYSDYIEELVYVLYEHEAKKVRACTSSYELFVYHKE